MAGRYVTRQVQRLHIIGPDCEAGIFFLIKSFVIGYGS